ncbi:MAG: rhamnogalacturonan acetylesterase [Opitutaceae bacterium]|nr:rhamnogalacturonan acetylesterase [Opitutaceae bacterium]
MILGKKAWAAFALGVGLAASAWAGPTLHLIGDSTMADKPKTSPNPETGWGQALPALLSDAVRVVNYAMNGRSTKSFVDEGRWNTVVAALQPGDWVIIQFGHNDEKADKPAVYAAARGAYQDNLRRFVRETRAKGGTPLLATPVARRRWSEAGELIDTHGDYPAALRAVAVEEEVPLLELNRLTTELERGHGVEGSKRLHLHYAPGVQPRWPEGVKDDTHYSEYGAGRVAALAVQELLRLQLIPGTWVR